MDGTKFAVDLFDSTADRDGWLPVAEAMDAYPVAEWPNAVFYVARDQGSSR